jgi:hypothetical protein
MDETSKIKNLSKYNSLLDRLRQPRRYMAKTSVPNLCYYLKEAGFDIEFIRNKVRHDLVDGPYPYSRRTIDENIPAEFKDPERIARGKRAAEKIKSRK